MNIKPLTEDLRPFFFQDGKPIETLVLGVTGHRHILPEAIPAIKHTFVSLIIKILRGNYQQQKPCPILLLSGMAQGADQIAAQMIAELKDFPGGNMLKLIAVLPMPEEDYFQDFKTPQQQADFEQAMNLADAKVVLPLTPENQRLRNQGEKIHRTDQYVQLADFISSSCYTLFAFWDGADFRNPKPGGTGDVVYKKFEWDNIPSCSLQQMHPYQEFVKEVIKNKALGEIVTIETCKDIEGFADSDVMKHVGDFGFLNIEHKLQNKIRRDMNQKIPTPISQLWYKKGLHFQCTGCGGCCTGQPGFIWITPQEKAAIAQFLNLSVEEFEQKYVRLVYGVRESLKELPEHNYDCIFFDSESRKCTIYDVRPAQCRTWPFWDSLLENKEAWLEAAKHCKGCNQGPLVPVEEIELKRKKISV